MGVIGFLDLPCGMTGEVFLACLIDAGWSEDRLRTVLGENIPRNVPWASAVEQVVKGALRAVVVDVFADDSAIETEAVINAARIGMKELGIERLYASWDHCVPWTSRMANEPMRDRAAETILNEVFAIEQPEIQLARVGIGTDRADHPWPGVARLWIGDSAST